MANRFLEQLSPDLQKRIASGETKKAESAETKKPESKNRFLSQIDIEELKKKEGTGTSIARTALQGVGYAKKYTWPADVVKMAIEGASRETLNEMIENDPSINKEIAEKSRQQSMEKLMKYFPTQERAEEFIEEKTGLPLRPKNELQKMMRQGSEAAAFRPGGIMQKGIAAVVAPAVTETAKAAGVPEWLSNIFGFVASGEVPGPKTTPLVKPSGMPVRRYESIEKPTAVTPARGEKIAQTLENDFRTIHKDILGKNKTYTELTENPNLRNDTIDMFKDVENLATNIAEPLNTVDVQKAFKTRLAQRRSRGYMDSEFEREFDSKSNTLNERFGVTEAPEEAPSKLVDAQGKPLVQAKPKGEPRGIDINAKKTVEQFRKNNEELRDLWEPGQSKAKNRAKAEAILEHNKAIEDVIKDKFKGTEFAKLFEESNKTWSDLINIQKTEEFADSLFEGKINYKNATKFFEDKSLRESLQRLVGKDGLKNYEILTKDLLTTERPMSFIKKAEASGFKELATLGSEFLIFPKAAVGHAGVTWIKRAYQTLLDKPKMAITWENSIQNLKKGNYREAERGFEQLKTEITQTSQKTQSAIQK